MFCLDFDLNLAECHNNFDNREPLRCSVYKKDEHIRRWRSTMLCTEKEEHPSRNIKEVVFNKICESPASIIIRPPTQV